MDISVIICTYDRAESLGETLNCLSKCDRTGISAEIIVVDNKGCEATSREVNFYKEILPVRYLVELECGVYGKSHALNRALGNGNLGDIIVVLDDDMSPHPDWLQGVAAITRRWPEKDIFTGRSYIIWPKQPLPPWACDPRLTGWAFSVQYGGEKDVLLSPARWFSGNQFWFRRRILRNGIRFQDMWLTEPRFILDLVEVGYEGVRGPDAVCGHRIQPFLLDEAVLIQRARKVGTHFAEVRLYPVRKTVPHSVLMKKHPLLGRLYCFLNLIRWLVIYYLIKIIFHDSRGFARKLESIERISFYRKALEISAHIPEYRLFRTKNLSDLRSLTSVIFL